MSSLRVSYSRAPALDEATLPPAPFALFAAWFAQAKASADPEPNAMCLATASPDARPSARMVLLKAFDDSGFVWYTNYGSRKAAQLEDNPFAALTFWWPSLERSVRIEGKVNRVPTEESDAYFESRPPTSRLGAWASDQSKPVGGRHVVEERWNGLVDDHLDEKGGLKKDVERPPHWGGFRLVPDRVEFWKGREARLHDRILYELAENEDWTPSEELKGNSRWTKTRLQP